VEVRLNDLDGVVVNHPAETAKAGFLLSAGNRNRQGVGDALGFFQMVERVRTKWFFLSRNNSTEAILTGDLTEESLRIGAAAASSNRAMPAFRESAAEQELCIAAKAPAPRPDLIKRRRFNSIASLLWAQ
jgi:hypothetical protein